MPWRIVFVAPFGLQHKTTVWARTLPLAQELARQGHRATILVPPWDSPADAGRVEEARGVRVEQVSLRGGLVGTVRRMAQRVAALQPHIIHIIKPRAHAGLVHWWLWQRRSRPLPRILLDVDDWEQAWSPINRYPWPVARFLAWQEEWGIRHADGITAASRWLEQRAQHMAPNTPRLYLPNGVNPLPTPPAARHSPDSPRILLFSRFVEVQPAWLAAFWAALLAIQPSARLIIAGTPVHPALEAPLRAALHGAPHITFTGYIPPAALEDLYASVDCAIFPAEPTPLQQAKCSVRLATTLLHGVPVVASAVGEQAHYGADGAAMLLSPEAAPQTFAQAVAALLSRPPSAAARAAASQRLLRRYAWADLGHTLANFYAQFLP